MKLTVSQPHIRRQDERLATRRLISERAVCIFGTAKWKTNIIDISATGAFVESEDLPPIGANVQLDFTLLFAQRGLRVRFQLRGVVVRAQVSEHAYHVLYAQGFCVRFLELSSKERLCLKAFTQSDTTTMRSLEPSA